MKGIDISEHNGSIDFNKVLNDGIEVVIMRCGYGRETKQKDKMFEDYYAKCQGKFKIATYLYSYANSVDRAEQEAENTLKLIDGKNFDYVFYDLEDKNAENLSKDTITEMYFAFKSIIENAGYKCGIYCNKYWANNKIDMSRITDIKWVASYGKNDGNIPSDSVKYNECGIWQYSDKGNVSGINSDVDMNIVYDWSNSSNNTTQQVTSIENKNSSTDNVVSVQKWLNNNYSCNLTEDGIYGKNTKAGLVKALQSELNKQFNKNLSVDGIFGDKTKNACVVIKEGATGNITKIIQSALVCNTYNLSIDGIFGNDTTKKVKAFQLNHNILADGIVGKNTFSKLLG